MPWRPYGQRHASTLSYLTPPAQPPLHLAVWPQPRGHRPLQLQFCPLAWKLHPLFRQSCHEKEGCSNQFFSFLYLKAGLSSTPCEEKGFCHRRYELEDSTHFEDESILNVMVKQKNDISSSLHRAWLRSSGPLTWYIWNLIPYNDVSIPWPICIRDNYIGGTPIEQPETTLTADIYKPFLHCYHSSQVLNLFILSRLRATNIDKIAPVPFLGRVTLSIPPQLNKKMNTNN